MTTPTGRRKYKPEEAVAPKDMHPLSVRVNQDLYNKILQAVVKSGKQQSTWMREAMESYAGLTNLGMQAGDLANVPSKEYLHAGYIAGMLQAQMVSEGAITLQDAEGTKRWLQRHRVGRSLVEELMATVGLTTGFKRWFGEDDLPPSP